MKLTTEQRNEFIAAFWDYLKTPRGYRGQTKFTNERRITGRGEKSPEGFLAVIEDILTRKE